MKSTNSLAVGLFFVLTSTMLPAGQPIVDAHIQAIGGGAAIAKIKTIRRTGESSFESQFGAFDGTVTESFVVGGRAYTSSDFGVFSERSGWNGNSAWIDTAQEALRDATENELKLLQISAAVNPIVAVKQYLGTAAFEVLGDKEFQGMKCEAIRLVDSPMVLFINSENKHLVGWTVTDHNPQLGGEFTAVLTYEDFRSIDGVQFPTKTTMDIADGMMTIITVYTKTETNIALDDALFQRPEN